jgi:hypothetical protein
MALRRAKFAERLCVVDSRFEARRDLRDSPPPPPPACSTSCQNASNLVHRDIVCLRLFIAHK